MLESNSPHRLWSRINLTLFIVAHIVLVFGLHAQAGAFTGLVIGILTGLAALWAWQTGSRIWTTPITSGLLMLAVTVEVKLFDAVRVPPPEPPELSIDLDEKGRYLFNRGGVFVVGLTYLAIPEEGEESSSPSILGAAVVINSLAVDSAEVRWISLRSRYKGRKHYRVRPLRPGETAPITATFATLTAFPAPGRGRIDLGEKQGVHAGDAYSLYHPGGIGAGGYLIIDEVGADHAEGYLVDAGAPSLPHDADRVGKVARLVEVAVTRGQVAFISGRRDDARKAFESALKLSAGKDARARAQLEALEAGASGTTPAREDPAPEPPN